MNSTTVEIESGLSQRGVALLNNKPRDDRRALHLSLYWYEFESVVVVALSELCSATGLACARLLVARVICLVQAVLRDDC